MSIAKLAVGFCIVFLASGNVSNAANITVTYTGTYTGSWTGNYDPTGSNPPDIFGGPTSGTIAQSDFSLVFTFDTSLAAPGYFTGSHLGNPSIGFPDNFFQSVGSASFSGGSLGFGGGFTASDDASTGSTTQFVLGEVFGRGGPYLSPSISMTATSPLITSSILTPVHITEGLSGVGGVEFEYENTFLGGGFGQLSLAPLTLDISVFPVTPVPEPSTWAMMLIGLAGIGFAARRQQMSSRNA
jgi:hypothetical protein